MAGPYYMPIAWMSTHVSADKNTVDRLQTTVLQLRKQLPFWASIAGAITGTLTVILLLAIALHVWWMRSQPTAVLFNECSPENENTFCKFKTSVCFRRLTSVISEQSLEE
ncbi:unnamed protein product [Dicrocoelium dendriticum]|nr:unnamed protein product [Dicrocoelium dendriticum]